MPFMCVHTPLCMCVNKQRVTSRGPLNLNRSQVHFSVELQKEARDGAVGNHSPASADYSLLRKMRFLSHRNSVIKIKYNVWLDSAKCTSTIFNLTGKLDKKNDLKHCV